MRKADSLRNGDGVSVGVLDDDDVARHRLSDILEDDVGLVERVGLDVTPFHEASAEDDWEVRVLDEHHWELDRLASDSDGPGSQVCDSAEAVEARGGVFGDEAVLQGELAGHVAVPVSLLHLLECFKRLETGQPCTDSRSVNFSGWTRQMRTIMRTFSIGPMEPMKVRTPSCRAPQVSQKVTDGRQSFVRNESSRSYDGYRSGPISGASPSDTAGPQGDTHLVVELVKGELVYGHTGSGGPLLEGLCRFCALATDGSVVCVVVARRVGAGDQVDRGGLARGRSGVCSGRVERLRVVRRRRSTASLALDGRYEARAERVRSRSWQGLLLGLRDAGAGEVDRDLGEVGDPLLEDLVVVLCSHIAP